MTAAIKPILKYPGAKWNLAAWIISHFPAHKHYVEPYFGSGAVFFNKKPAAHEVINDLSGDVVNLFRVIRERGEELAALIEMTPWAREEFDTAKEQHVDSVERARRFLIRSYQGHSGGGLRGENTWSYAAVRKADSSGDFYPIRTWHQLPDRVLGMVNRLIQAEIDNRTAVEVITRCASSDVLIYADPPYKMDARRAGIYAHEMTDADHVLLLDALDAHPGPVVLSGYHCALYDERLAHWHVREKQAQAEKGNTRTEVLWLNQVCIDRLGYGPMFDEVSHA